MIRELIELKAAELALHDGVAATVVHIHAAASLLMSDIAREKDFLVASFRRPAVSSPTTAPALEDLPAAPEPLPASAAAEPATPEAAPNPVPPAAPDTIVAETPAAAPAGPDGAAEQPRVSV